MPENRPGLDELTATIEALRNELAHLHRAMGLRAIIEQAKGVLMAQNGIGAPAAFDRLRDISQAQNARLVDVAATIVGASLPSGEGLDVDDVALPHRVRPSQSSSPTWRSLRAQPNVRRGAAGAVLDVLASGTEDGREAATLVRDFLAPLGVEAVSLWRTRADASIEQVGQVGYATDTMVGLAAGAVECRHPGQQSGARGEGILRRVLTSGGRGVPAPQECDPHRGEHGRRAGSGAWDGDGGHLPLVAG
jgi:hypothetical protein